MHRTIIALLLLSSILWADLEYGSFELDGYERDYIVFLPENFEPGLPLVFNLHGYGGTAEWQIEHTLMNQVADTANFVVVYPNAINTVWNSGISNNPNYPAPDVDDVAFISALIDTVYANYQINLDRVYTCGMSNGGFMTLKLVCELNNRFAKAASLAGAMTNALMNDCDSALPIPMLLMHATGDSIVLYRGSEYWSSADETLGHWVDFNGCYYEADTLSLPDIDLSDECTVDVIQYNDCDDNSEVVMYILNNAGHTWPGWGEEYETGTLAFLGATIRDITADVEIWNFFNSERFEIRGIWGNDLLVNSIYADPSIDSLEITATITNTHDHAYEAYAILKNMDSTLVDSFQLFDDGLHNDGEAGDGLAKALVPALQTESHIFVQTTTLDIDEGRYFGPHDYARFTTVGPLANQALVQLHPAEGAIAPNSNIYFNLYIENLGSMGTAEDIIVNIHPADTNSTLVSGTSSAAFEDIPAGEIRSSLTYFVLRTGADVEDGTPIRFNIEISSQGVTYWEDSGIILGYVGIEDERPGIPLSYSLDQNFPNPFNPTTTISYDLPEQSMVNLAVFDIQGQEVMMIQDAAKSPGNYEVQWNGLDQSGNQVSTGVYFARLNAGKFSQTIKMLYLK
ncbi:MAG: T9SS type A sorting domain-containing protein [FCB group bacterium]|nr:T9SS type A sorting domain-containing protein [FCB group bacterium]MBL7121142.1 T9SS type A sorting domain-containing protein [Candidatus Neomarinimicrobiota bacterium]